MNIIDAIIEHKVAVSKGEARRLICSKAIKLNGTPVDDLITEVNEGDLMQVGRKKEIEIRLGSEL